MSKTTIAYYLRPFLSLPALLRILADVILINASVLGAAFVRFMWGFLVIETQHPTLWEFLAEFGKTLVSDAWMLTPLCIFSLMAFGVYTHTRAYRGRYKAIAIGQAVALAYLLFGVVSFFFYTEHILARSVLVMAMGLSIFSLITARLWRMGLSLITTSTTSDTPRKLTLQTPTSAAAPAKANATMPHILVIGGAGYIGSALLPKLLERGYRVRLLDMLLFGIEPIQPWLNHPNLEIVQADFRQVDKVVQAMRDVDAVVHLGALVGDPACALDEDMTIEINLSATRTIAEVAKGEGVQRFIFASTCSVYGASDELLDERSALNPVSLYARSKIAAERVLLQLTDQSFAPTILRFGTIYGLSGRTRFDLVINLLSAKAVTEGKITVMGGDQWRPFVHVDDAASAVLKALEAPVAVVRNQTFNVGSNAQNYTIEGAAKVIHGLVPGAQLIDMGMDGDRRNYRVSFNKISKALNFAPAWTVERGVQQVIDAIKTGKVQNYKDAQYSNVKFLSEEGMTRLARPSINWEKQLIEQSENATELEDLAVVPIA